MLSYSPEVQGFWSATTYSSESSDLAFRINFWPSGTPAVTGTVRIKELPVFRVENSPKIRSEGNLVFKRVNELSSEEQDDIVRFMDQYRPLMEKLKDK